MINVSIDDRELKQALDKLGKKANTGIRKGSRAGLKLVQSAAKANAPKRTGKLRKGLKVRAIPARGKNKIVGTKIDLKDVYYMGFIEYGTKTIDAREFLKKAAEQTGRQALATAIATIKQQLESK